MKNVNFKKITVKFRVYYAEQKPEGMKNRFHLIDSP